MQLPARVRKGNCGGQPAGIGKCRKIGPGRVVFDGARGKASRTGGGIEVLFESGDEVLEIVDPARQVDGALLFARERLLGGGLLLLPCVDEHVQAQLLVREPVEVLRQCRALGDDILAHPRKIGEVAGERIGLRAHVGNHGAERNRGAQCLQRILRPHQQRGRRLLPDALQSGEYFDDHAASLVERFLKDLFAVVERLQARLRRIDLRLDVADARRRFDELLIKRPPILAERLDLQPELGLAVCRLTLLGADRIKLLVVLLERIFGRRGARRRYRRSQRNLGARRLGRRRLRKRDEIGAERQQPSPEPSRARSADRRGATVGESCCSR